MKLLKVLVFGAILFTGMSCSQFGIKSQCAKKSKQCDLKKSQCAKKNKQCALKKAQCKKHGKKCTSEKCKKH